jgi:hypothetical protein
MLIIKEVRGENFCETMVIENLAKVKRKTLPEVQANLLLANLREGYQILKASSSVTMCQRRLDAS